jgi:hypothetical protein
MRFERTLLVARLRGTNQLRRTCPVPAYRPRSVGLLSVMRSHVALPPPFHGMERTQ